MRNLRHSLLLVVVLMATVTTGVHAQDGGVPAVCGVITDDGVCVGNTAVWCSVENAAGEGAGRDTVSFDCEDHAGTCAELGGVGAWCLVPTGASCAVAAIDRVGQLACGANAVDLGLGCDLDEGCRAVSVPCPPEGQRTCSDGTLVLSCSRFGQALVARCAGACVDNACRDQPIDALCDDESLSCAPGLSCLGAPSGRCVDAFAGPATDAGPDRRDPFEQSACACVVTDGAQTSAASGFALVAIASCRRRRTR